jgi:hypothetical protein
MGTGDVRDPRQQYTDWKAGDTSVDLGKPWQREEAEERVKTRIDQLVAEAKGQVSGLEDVEVEEPVIVDRGLRDDEMGATAKIKFKVTGKEMQGGLGCMILVSERPDRGFANRAFKSESATFHLRSGDAFRKEEYQTLADAKEAFEKIS